MLRALRSGASTFAREISKAPEVPRASIIEKSEAFRRLKGLTTPFYSLDKLISEEVRASREASEKELKRFNRFYIPRAHSVFCVTGCAVFLIGAGVPETFLFWGPITFVFFSILFFTNLWRSKRYGLFAGIERCDAKKGYIKSAKSLEIYEQMRRETQQKKPHWQSNGVGPLR